MLLKNYLNSGIKLVGAICLLIGFTSCGSYQYAGYEEDGIYGTSDRPVQYVEVAPVESQSNNSDYYTNYFKEKALELEDNTTDDVYFTDIDSYSSDYEVANDTLDYQGYGGWGQNTNPNDVTIAIYNRPFMTGFYPWSWRNRFFSPFAWHGNWGFYDYWNSPFYIGWNSPNWYHPYYGFGFGFGYSNFWFNNFSGYPYYGYGNNFYNRRSYAYNAGRRGSIYSNSGVSGITNRRNVVGRSSLNTNRRSSISSSANRTRFSSDAVPRRRATFSGDDARPRRSTTTTRPRTTTTRPRTSRSNNTFTRPSRTTTRSSSTRSNNYNRSSSSRSRSSGTYRSSSGSSSRSSGVSRSSGSRSNSSGSRSSSRRNNL